MKQKSNLQIGEGLKAGASNLPNSGDIPCHRCGGLVIRDHVIDLMGNQGQIFVNILRCLQCGAVEDPVIVRNRQAGPGTHPKPRLRRLAL